MAAQKGERCASRFVDGVVKYHRTIERYVDALLEAGVRLARLEKLIAAERR